MSSPTQQPVSKAPAESQGNGPAVPVWLIVVMFLILYWGALYFDANGGWFSPHVYAPYKSVADVQLYQPKGGGNEVFDQGKIVYGKTCVACHQASGQGAPGQFPPLVGSDWVNEKEPGRMIRLVLQGLQGPITVKGQAFNNTMVPWNALSDDDIAAVITYVRGNKDWGNNASPVTPAQIKAMRDKVKAHPGSFNPDELLKISPAE